MEKAYISMYGAKVLADFLEFGEPISEYKRLILIAQLREISRVGSHTEKIVPLNSHSPSERKENENDLRCKRSHKH